MGDVVFVLAVLIQPAVLLGRGHTIARTVKQMLVSGVIAGITVQTLDLLGLDMRQSLISAVGTAVPAVFILFEFGTSRPAAVKSDRRSLLFLLPSALLGTLVVISRLMADGQQSHSLTNINFIGSEDNAKWLNVISQLVSGDHVVVGNVGGICVSFLSGIVSMTRTFFPLLSFSTNEVPLLIDCLVVAQVLLMLALPVVIMPVYRRAFSWGEIWAVLPVHTVVAFFLMSSSSRFMDAGHLSAQLVLVFGLGAMIHFVCPDEDPDGWSMDQTFVGLVLVLGVTTSWLPLQVLSAVASLILGFALIKALIIRRVSGRDLHWLGTGIIVTAGGLLVARNTFVYVTSHKNTVTNLLSATGATPVHTTMVNCLAMISVLLVAVSVPRAASQVLTPALWSVVTVAGVLAAFVMADYVRTGKSNYGTQKLSYLVVTVVVGSLLIPGFLNLLSKVSSDLRPGILVALASALSLGLVTEGSLLPWLELTKASQWHSTDSVADSPWARFTLPDDEPGQNLGTIPITCAIEKAGSRVPVLDYTTYVCTRFLTSMAGLESTAGPLVEWQLRNDWETSRAYLSELPDEILDRNMIRLNESSEFVGLAPIRSILGD